MDSDFYGADEDGAQDDVNDPFKADQEKVAAVEAEITKRKPVRLLLLPPSSSPSPKRLP